MKIKSIIFTALIAASTAAIADDVYMPCTEECGDVMESPEFDPNHAESIAKLPAKVEEKFRKITGDDTIGGQLSPVGSDPVLGQIYHYDDIYLACSEGVGYVIRKNKFDSDIIAVSSAGCPK